MHADYADPSRRAALYALFDRTWPGIEEKIGHAARMGWEWARVTTPFARYEGQRAISHVGVLEVPMVLDGVAHQVAGIHAVCTDRDHRRRGHYRALMEEALRFVDSRWSICKLSTEQPELYEPFGFRAVEMRRFVLERSGPGGGDARALGQGDSAWLGERLTGREPVSHRVAATDPGWLFGIDEVLWTGGLEHLYAVEDAVVAWEVTGAGLQIYDVAAPVLPSIETILAASPWPFERVVLWVAPDRLAPTAEAIPWPEDDVLMVRGPWPVSAPFALSPLAAH